MAEIFTNLVRKSDAFSTLGSASKWNVTHNGETWVRVENLSVLNGVRQMVQLANLVSNETYTWLVEIYNPGDNPIELYMDWADTPAVMHIIQPKEQKFIRASGAKEYTSTFRFGDLAGRYINTVWYMRNMSVVKGEYDGPAFNGDSGVIRYKSQLIYPTWNGPSETSTSSFTWEPRRPDKDNYEHGISHGVVFPNGGPGVPWNGLTGINHTKTGGTKKAYYHDGVKVLDRIDPGNFQATLDAYSYPPEFQECLGERSVIPGFNLTRQPRAEFHLSYRTNHGPDDYKLHLIYNAVATPTSRGFSTLSDRGDVPAMSWQINAVPVQDSGFPWRSTAHFIIHTSQLDPYVVQDLESKLYGRNGHEPQMPDFDELLGILYNVITEPLTEPI